MTTKSELIKLLSKKHSTLYQKDVISAVELVFQELCEGLQQGRRIELRGFGAFSLRKRQARKARNPRTNETVDLGERFVPYFRPGKELREKINSQE